MLLILKIKLKNIFVQPKKCIYFDTINCSWLNLQNCKSYTKPQKRSNGDLLLETSHCPLPVSPTFIYWMYYIEYLGYRTGFPARQIVNYLISHLSKVINENITVEFYRT